MNQTDILSVREQIQQDILSYASVVDDEKIFFNDEVLVQLCQIVVDNFDKFVKWFNLKLPWVSYTQGFFCFYSIIKVQDKFPVLYNHAPALVKL